MQLNTDRLVLRPMTLDDVPALNEIERNPDVTRYMTFDPQSLSQTRGYIESSLADQSSIPRRVYEFAIDEKSESRLIGRCGLRCDRPEHHEAIIWYLLHPAFWGKGYACEAVSALIAFGFQTLTMHRIWADCDPRNTPSCKLAERVGMRLEGRLRENYLLRGEWCDTAVYAILAQEWASAVR
jgi:RimJ/RimL family protein N-acetyltransferase